MARTRNLKPTYFTNEQLARCEPLARLLFAGLWCLADKDGRLEDRPERIKLGTLPYDACDVDKLLDQLHQGGFVHRYTVDDARIIQIAKWNKHARPHPGETSYGLPPPPDGAVKFHETSGSSPASCALTYSSNSNLNTPLPPVGGDATADQPKPRKPTDAPAPGFDAFWEAYPRKDAKARAVKAWNSLLPDPLLLAEMLSAITRQRQSAQWLRDDGQYIPLPATWLNGRYWENKGVQGIAQESPQQRVLRIIEEQRKCNGSTDG